MAVLRRPVPRFLVWATVLVAVAIATGAAGLDWWLIAVVELVAWAAVTLAERMVWRLSAAAPVQREEHAVQEISLLPPPPPEAAPPAPEPAAAYHPAEPEPVTAVLELEPVVPLVPGPVAEPSWRRRRMPAQTERPPVVSSLPLPRDHVRWNIWSLERLAKDHPNVEELEFIVLSLRDFADSDGQLPADFDPLVRESFGELLLG